jgi:hypothetical protein
LNCSGGLQQKDRIISNWDGTQKDEGFEHHLLVLAINISP